VDQHNDKQLFLIFLSDGAPSDHCFRECRHGFCVWQASESGEQVQDKAGQLRKKLTSCISAWKCRKAITDDVLQECLDLVSDFGDTFGRDRLFLATVAFGSPEEDYQVMQTMSKKLPRSSFQKLGLSTGLLKTSLSSLTSTMTSLCSSVTSASLTLRRLVMMREDQVAQMDVYLHSDPQLKKQVYNRGTKVYERAPFESGADGFAIAKNPFEQGAEWVVYKSCEIKVKAKGQAPATVGPMLVAKEPKHEELLDNKDFYTKSCRIQGEAEALAQLFNRRLNLGPAFSISFVQCYLWQTPDLRKASGVGLCKVEQELTGKFRKWNNNAGHVTKKRYCKWERPEANVSSDVNPGVALGAIGEDDEEEEDQHLFEFMDPNDVPSCFSHFTFVSSEERQLVCDLQGTWNVVDGL